MTQRVIDVGAVEAMKTEGTDFQKCFCRFAISRETMNTDACMFRATFLPGGFHAPHVHTKSDEFFYVISCGEAVTGIEGEVYQMREGMFFCFPKNVKHWTKNLDSSKNLELVTCYPQTGSIDESGYVYEGELIPKFDVKRVIRVP
jgi:quercetin dioxygenase-like cupin family protein